MTGFDMRGGRSFPLIEGVVVCAHFEQRVLLAHAEEEKCALPFTHCSVSLLHNACSSITGAIDTLPHYLDYLYY